MRILGFLGLCLAFATTLAVAQNATFNPAISGMPATVPLAASATAIRYNTVNGNYNVQVVGFGEIACLPANRGQLRTFYDKGQLTADVLIFGDFAGCRVQRADGITLAILTSASTTLPIQGGVPGDLLQVICGGDVAMSTRIEPMFEPRSECDTLDVDNPVAIRVPVKIDVTGTAEPIAIGAPIKIAAGESKLLSFRVPARGDVIRFAIDAGRVELLCDAQCAGVGVDLRIGKHGICGVVPGRTVTVRALSETRDAWLTSVTN